MDFAQVHDEVYTLAQSQSEPIASHVREALHVIEESLQVHGQDHVSISFNGGKDCTVLLHLLVAVLHHHHGHSARSPTHTSIAHSDASPDTNRPIPACYIPVPSPFPVLEEFIDKAAKAYNLDLYQCTVPSPVNDTGSQISSLPVESVVTPGPSPSVAGSLSSILSGKTEPNNDGTTAPKENRDYLTHPSTSPPPPKAVGKSKGGEGMRLGLQTYKNTHPGIKAILIGTRRTDPHGAKLSYRNMCDPGWPEFERINPIINWTYADVWTFLRKLKVPYCSLYDEGYTSLGSTYNTFPNPALAISEPKVSNGTAEHRRPQFRPAYELEDGSLERAGRGANTASLTSAA